MSRSYKKHPYMVGLLELNLQSEKPIKRFVEQMMFLVANLIDEFLNLMIYMII